jgi:hypothetical protein
MRHPSLPLPSRHPTKPRSRTPSPSSPFFLSILLLPSPSETCTSSTHPSSSPTHHLAREGHPKGGGGPAAGCGRGGGGSSSHTPHTLRVGLPLQDPRTMPPCSRRVLLGSERWCVWGGERESGDKEDAAVVLFSEAMQQCEGQRRGERMENLRWCPGQHLDVESDKALGGPEDHDRSRASDGSSS